jgi:hypothetical protein
MRRLPRPPITPPLQRGERNVILIKIVNTFNLKPLLHKPACPVGRDGSASAGGGRFMCSTNLYKIASNHEKS